MSLRSIWDGEQGGRDGVWHLSLYFQNALFVMRKEGVWSCQVFREHFRVLMLYGSGLHMGGSNLDLRGDSGLCRANSKVTFSRGDLFMVIWGKIIFPCTCYYLSQEPRVTSMLMCQYLVLTSQVSQSCLTLRLW